MENIYGDESIVLPRVWGEKGPRQAARDGPSVFV